MLMGIWIGNNTVYAQAVGRNWYVDKLAASGGSGTSFSQAFNDLRTAIDTARARVDAIPDTIRVKGGAAQVFFPTDGTDRDQKIWVTFPVVLLGGYNVAGTARDPINNKAIISGDIGVSGDSSDNSIRVIELLGNCILDGFQIQDGYTSCDEGAGLAVYREFNIVRNCRLTNNYAINGGALLVFNNARNVLSVENCDFDSNYSIGEGGAIYAVGDGVRIINSRFLHNSSAGLGGVISMYGDSIFISGSRFESNVAYSHGGALYLRLKTVRIVSSQFIADSVRITNGGAAYIECDSLYIDSCRFEYNKAIRGGGVCFLGKRLIITRTMYNANNAVLEGGALHLYNDIGYGYGDVWYGLVIDKSSFTANSASKSGGAVSWIGKGIMHGCSFTSNNVTAGDGGAIAAWFHAPGDVVHFRDYSRDTSSTYTISAWESEQEIDSTHTSQFINCTFNNNSARNGSAVANYNGTLKGCLFNDNNATTAFTVAGFDSTYGDDALSVINCTFADNTAPSGQSAGVNECKGTIKNSIFWNNAGDQLSSTAVPTYSIIQNWTGGGAWNTAKNPYFKGVAPYPYSVAGYSSVVNGGDPAFSSSDTSGWYTDLSGNRRLNGMRVDLGAYEYHSNIIYVDSRATGTNNGYSWGNAFNDLQDALQIAVDGDTIWVARGTYCPDRKTGNRDSSFVIPDGVVVLGGFRGNETSSSSRNWNDNVTALSGEIGNTADVADNSNTICYLRSGSRIDGFQITKAYGTDYGAVVLFYSTQSSIANCTFYKNHSSRSGGAVSSLYGNYVTIESSFFIENSADSSSAQYCPAGGIGISLSDSFTIKNSVFYHNTTNGDAIGGAVAAYRSNVILVNTTFYRPSESAPILSADESEILCQNSIIQAAQVTIDTMIYLYNSLLRIDNSVVQGGSYGITASGTSSINSASTIFDFDPLFTDAEHGDLTLSFSSPCIDRGVTVDTAGWSRDVDGKLRVYNNEIDLGAYEFQGFVTPQPPVLLSTLNQFEIPANGTITINLDRKDTLGHGYYVRYDYRDISELVWQVVAPDTNVDAVINADSSQLIIAIKSYRPGSSFIVRLRAADPVFTSVTAEKNVTFRVVSPLFDICRSDLVQNEFGRDFSGQLEVRNTLYPMSFSRNRIFLGDDKGTSYEKLQYIDGITLTETAPPRSRGGATECGLYEFGFNGSGAIVYNANGTSTSKTLFQWAIDSLSRYPGSIFYKKNQKLRCVLPVTNGVDGVKYVTLDVRADFDVPLTKLSVTGDQAHQQTVSWQPFADTLKALTLFIEPLDSAAPPADTIVFDSLNFWRTSHTFKALQDSRRYRYILRAADKYGNVGESEVIGTTPSDYYSISGIVEGFSIPVDTAVTLYLYRVEAGNVKTFLRSVSVKLDSAFTVDHLTNGQYVISAVSGNHYFPNPVEESITVMRSDVSGIRFVYMPDPVVNADGVRVEQIEGSGDLVFTVKTNPLFSGEVPFRMNLAWEGGDTLVDTASQIIPVPLTYTETMLVDGSAIWKFTIARSDIEDSILSRHNFFDINVRYVHSLIETQAFGYPVFRSAPWNYPSPDSMHILFAAQRFRKPSPPRVSVPVPSADDAAFIVHSVSPGPGMKVVTEFQRCAGPASEIATTDIPNSSGTILDINKRTWMICPLDWNYSSRGAVDSLGRRFAMGITLDTVTGSFKNENGFIVPGSSWIGGSTGDTAVYTSWLLDVPVSGSYWGWVYLTKSPRKDSKMYISFGQIDTAKKFMFDIKKSMSPGWQKIYMTGFPLSNRDVQHALPVLLKGKVNINVFFPENDVAASAFGFTLKGNNENWPNIDSNIVKRVVPWGNGDASVAFSGFNLLPNNYYNLKVYVYDRFGNVSDTVRIDSVKTTDSYINNNIAIHQKADTGSLILSISGIDSAAAKLDSIIFHFDGNDYRMPVNSTINRTGPTEVTLTRDELAPLIAIDAFKRHTLYDSLYLIFSAETSWIKTTSSHYEGACNCSDPVHETCITGTKTEKRLVVAAAIFGIPIIKTVTKNVCDYSRTDTLHDTVHTPRIPAIWPGAGDLLVASQEYRDVTAPVLDSVEITARSVRLACRNLNIYDSALVKEQMNGELYIKYSPGSLCSDSSMDTVRFGNRFTMHDNWIAFVPSFEGALRTRVGDWHEQDTLGTRHQWLDSIVSGNPLAGGLFYPNIGYTVPVAEITSNPRQATSLSMGIIVSNDQASSSPSDPFHLWVLPSKVNGPGNSVFYWGLDTVPFAAGDAENFSATPDWIKGPDLYLPAGEHMIDLFMVDDGVGIAAVALSKDTAAPPPILALSRWGDAGFDCELVAHDLPANQKIVFTCQAVDRFGNRSPVVTHSETTLSFDEPIPGVVITPDVPLENGIYHSIYPSFTISTTGNYTDTLTLETQLRWNHGGSSDSISLLNTALIDTLAHIWNTVVDSTLPLPEFPDSGGVSSTNGYSLRARVITRKGEPGNWTQLVFGVVADSNEISPTAIIVDTLYEMNALKFRFDHGVTIAPTTVVGDLEILFDFENSSGKRLMLEGATIVTDTARDTSGLYHAAIDTVYGGTIAAYDCDDYSWNCSRSPVFRFPYGKYTVEMPAESLSIVDVGGIKKLSAPSMSIFDDNNSRARLSASRAAPVPVTFTKSGITDSCFATQDRFFFENVLTFGTVQPGFHIDACITAFARDTAADTYTITAAGNCGTCGPDLKYSVLSPRYLDEEFSVFDPLRDPVTMTYTGTDPDYQINFGGGVNTVDASRCTTSTYMGWNIDINSYTFGPNGVTVTDFDIGLNEETFPPEKNGGSSKVTGFSGIQIKGDTLLNDGALHISGSATAPGSGVAISSSNDYVFTNVNSLLFAKQADNSYLLTIPDTCSLRTPSWKNESFNEYGKSDSTIVVTVHPDTGFVLASDGLVQVNASGNFNRSIGQCDSSGTLIINGELSVTYAARDFQLRLVPIDTNALFTVAGCFVGQGGDVPVHQASIGLFSDFTINTLYGKVDDGKRYSVTPNQFGILPIESQGFDIFKTSAEKTGGIRILMLAPDFPFSTLIDMAAEKAAESNPACNGMGMSMYNAGFDLDKNLTNISGRIDLPEDVLACLGIKGMGDIGEKIAKFKLKTIYLGLQETEDNGKLFTVGADAFIELGSLFNPIGLQGEKILLEKVTAGYEAEKDGTKKDWKLMEMHASAFALPRLIGIGPKNFSTNLSNSDEDKQLVTDRDNGKNYIELYTGGKGFTLNYHDSKLDLEMNNWALRITDQFPIPQLRGASFVLDRLVYERNGNDKGRITELRGRGEYIPPGGRISIGGAHLCGTKVELGFDKEEDGENSTDVNAYFGIKFDTLIVGDRVFPLTNGTNECQTQFKFYFDGRYSGQGCLVWKEKIGIVPWGDTVNPKIYIQPEPTGATLSFKFEKGEGFTGSLKKVHLLSKDEIPVLDTILDVGINELTLSLSSEGKFGLNALDVDWWIYKEIMNTEGFRLSLNKINFGYNNGSSWDGQKLEKTFSILAQPDFDFKLSKQCKVNIVPQLGFIVKTDTDTGEQRRTKFVWDVDGDFKCDFSGLGFGADFKISNDTIGFTTAWLEAHELEKYGFVKKDDSKDDEKKAELENDENLKKIQLNVRPEISAGVKFKNAIWIKENKKWTFNPNRDKKNNGFAVIPTFKVDQPIDINGFGVKTLFNFERLFESPNPGIGLENVRILVKKAEIPTGISLYIDGKKPYVHPEWNKPAKFTIRLPEMEIGSLKLGEALLEFGVEKPASLDYETWFVRGMASMELSPALDNLTVDIAFEKPHPWENVTGIRHAKVKLHLAPSCRIQLGSLPVFIAGFEGALYDGSGMPEGAIACHIPKLEPGLKVEAAMLLEFQEPTVAHGKVGFWVHLRRFNLGINGQVEVLEGIADAEACAAIYNNGQAFHGHFLVYVHLGLSAKGRFTIDIWKDSTGGGNFTADALASIGLSKGSLIKGKLIKIPPKDFWFMDMFTRAGKFEDRVNGLTTGIRFFGKTWGVGILNGKFKSGDVGKYKLKQAPVIVPGAMTTKLAKSRMMIPPPQADSNITKNTVNPGFILEGGEVISFLAATDSGYYEWPANVLIVKDAATDSADWDSTHYIPVAGRGDDTLYPKLYVQDNTVARVWTNENNYDSILIYVPDTVKKIGDTLNDPLPPHGGFEYMFFAGLKPAKIDIQADPYIENDTLRYVTFSGHVDDFQGRIRNLLRRKDDGTDTLLRQRMDLHFITSSLSPMPADTFIDTAKSEYLYNFINIPISQFEGYGPGDTSLLDNPNVNYTESSKTLYINNLKWIPTKAAPGTYALCAAVEVTDFVVEDGSGTKTIIPDSLEREASVYREDPVVLSHPSENDTVIVSIVSSQPITRPTGFTATGSEAAPNWAGESEKRNIYLRWNADDNSGLNGYQITWKPSFDTEGKYKRTAIVGRSDHYTITIPELDSTYYTDDSIAAQGEMYVKFDTIITSNTYKIACDSGTPFAKYEVGIGYYRDSIVYDKILEIDSVHEIRPNRLYPGLIDTMYYKAKRFDITLTPFASDDSVYTDSNYLFTGNIKELHYIHNELLADSAVSCANVALGIDTGSANNNYTIAFKPEQPYSDASGYYNGLPVEVPLNTGAVVNAEIAVSSASPVVDPSRYGEVWARVVSEDTTIIPNAMPRTGAFNTYFTVQKSGSDTVTTGISFRPIEKTYLCKEMFSSTCRKVKVDSLGNIDTNSAYESCTEGCTKSISDPGALCSDCDPGAKDNKLPMNTPCNGQPDSVIYGRTPFGLYTAYLYVVNNGRRGTPVVDNSAAPVVYDSIQFKVVPPKPVLHEIRPDYILFDHDDTLSLAVSDLWINDSTEKPLTVRISYTDSLGVIHDRYKQVSAADIRPILTHEDSLKWKGMTNADWIINLPTKTDTIPGTGEIDLRVAVVNTATDRNNDTVRSVSNEIAVAYVNNPDTVECPREYYDPDRPNARFVMDWIGNYPRNPSPGDTVFVRFTEMHDLNPASYDVKVLRGLDGGTVDSITITNFTVHYEGIRFVFPDTIDTTSQKIYRILTNYTIDKIKRCRDRFWGKDNYFSVIPSRQYEIVQAVNGFYIRNTISTADQYIDRDEIRYYIGKNYFVEKVPTEGYNHLIQPPKVIPMAQSGFVTVFASVINGGTDTLQKWIDVTTQPYLIKINGDTVPGNFIAEPGDTLLIYPLQPKMNNWTSTQITNTYRFGNYDVPTKGTMIILTADARSPLVIERWAETRDGQYGPAKRSMEGTRSYNFTLRTWQGDSSIAITVPSARILDAVTQKVENYPMLLRLDTTVAQNIGTMLRTPFHFRDSRGTVLPFEIETIDTITNTAVIWTKMTINPAIGNNTIYMVTGSKPENPRQLWNGYTTVLHCTPQSSILPDATGNGNSLPVPSGAVFAKNLIDTTLSLSGSPAVWQSGRPLPSSPRGITISLWVNLASIPATTVPLITLCDNANTAQAQLTITADSSVAFTIGNDTLKAVIGAIEENTWLYIAGVCNWFDGASGEAIIYINGLPIASKPQMNYGNPITPVKSMRLADSSFVGMLDEIRISADATSYSKLALDYYTQRKRNDFLKHPAGVTSVTEVSNPQCQLKPSVKSGDYCYIGSDKWRLGDLPLDLNGTTGLFMSWSDRYSQGDSLVEIKLNGPAKLYMLIDSRYIPKPAFLTSYENTGRTVAVENRDGVTVPMQLYMLQIDTATAVLLGGPEQGGIDGGEVPWVALLDCRNDNGQIRVAAKPWPFVRTAAAGEKALLFSDREHTVDTLPEEFRNGVLVTIPNAMRFSDTGSLMTLRVNRPGTVNCLLDTMYTTYPSFITDKPGWCPIENRCVANGKTYSVLKRTITQDEVLSLDGPRSGGGIANRTSYALIVQPAADTATVVIGCPDEIPLAVLDTGATPYIDSAWHITMLPKELKNKLLIRTRQTDYQSTDNNASCFTLAKGAKIYIAVDEEQSIVPAFLLDIDSVTGTWAKTRFTIELSNHAVFRVFRKVFKEGYHELPGVRSGGSSDNLYNYFVFADTAGNKKPVIPEVDTNRIVPFDTAVVPYNDLQTKVTWGSPELYNSFVIIAEKAMSEYGYCRTQSFTFTQPVRIWLALDPAFRTAETFIEKQNWTRTTAVISLSGNLPDRVLYSKEFVPGTIEIPGVNCDYIQSSVMEPMILFELLEAPTFGLIARNLRVTGFGEEREGTTDNYIVKDLDIKYAWDMGMSSRSWIVNVEARSAVADRGDTMVVLTPFVDDTIIYMNDTTIIREGNSFTLPDLLPGLVDADGVHVDAVNNAANGVVMFRINNQSKIPVNKQFIIVLFEDLNGDFLYTRNEDRRIGSAVVQGIDSNQVKTYLVSVNGSLSFPNRAICAFVDADNWIVETDEWNNVATSGTSCEDYTRPVYVCTDTTASGYDSTRARMHEFADTAIICYLADTNNDSLVTTEDSLYALFVYNNQLHAINAAGDSLFSAINLDALAPMDLILDDLTGDGTPEIIAGNRLYSNTGTLLWDASLWQSGSPAVGPSSFDFNRDGDRDTIICTPDTFVTIRSGRDSTLLYINPLSTWPNPTDGATGTLAYIARGEYHCYDVNVSFPRYSVVSGDTVDLTVRFANAGAYGVKNVTVTAYADTSNDTTNAQMNNWIMLGDTTVINPMGSQVFTDTRFTKVIPAGTKRIWFVADRANKYFECNERDNVIRLSVE
jgi:predicted outer membrane repeat protein